MVGSAATTMPAATATTDRVCPRAMSHGTRMRPYGFTMTVSHQPSGPSLAARLQCKHRADDDENEQQVDLSEDQFPRVVLAKADDQQGSSTPTGSGILKQSIRHCVAKTAPLLPSLPPDLSTLIPTARWIG